jgi:TRAP-type mannitol/chloroaromatic compound transport system substrate-binding protein
MKRRDVIKLGGTATASVAALGAPSIGKAKPKFRWRMTDAYPTGTPYLVSGPGGSADFAERVTTMSEGELEITHYGAGELIPALEGFDAVREGTVEMNAGTSYFWKGRVLAAQVFSGVPFGMDARGNAAWLYMGNGLNLWQETYKPLGLMALPLNDSGVQMSGWFREPLKDMSDIKGVKIRAPGLGGDILGEAGANVQLLPAGEIFPSLERGVIDAAEFVGPYLDRRLGLHQAVKNYYTTGWHEPSTVGELLINKKKWDELPKHLQEIVRNAAQACHWASLSQNDAINSEALNDLVENKGVTAQPLPDPIVKGLRETAGTFLAGMRDEDEQFRRVIDDYWSFRRQWSPWAGFSEGEYHRGIRPLEGDFL